MIRGYDRGRSDPKCMTQIDLKKAYDMVEWRALEVILREFGFPWKFIGWIMHTVKTVTYVFNINGTYTHSMKAKRGIQQWDPISPLLFVLIMEYPTRNLHQLDNILDFNYHTKCEKLKLTSLSFVDDLLLFTRGYIISMELMLKHFEQFSLSTSLGINPSKCFIYFGYVDQVMKDAIIRSSGFKEGSLPFRYLGIPLTSKKLAIKYYLPLIDKIM